MDIKDNIIFGFSIIIACLVAIPIVLLIGTIIFQMFSTLIICLIYLGLYTPSFILYLVGSLKNRSKLTSVGYGLGLPSYLLAFLTVIVAFLEIGTRATKYNEFIFLVLYGIIWVASGPGRTFNPGSIPLTPLVPIWVTGFVIGNLILVIICIILGSIIFKRRNNLKTKEEFAKEAMKKGAKRKKTIESKIPKIQGTPKEIEAPKVSAIQIDTKARIEKLKKILKVSTRVKFETMRNALEMDPKAFDKMIFDWADQFGFTIEEDIVVINKESIDNFIKMLDSQFKTWEDKEKSKEGKI